tara:strand:- start:2510 stop:2794 length:285 start_codon:yes stop_codon:yes gene_type:complete
MKITKKQLRQIIKEEAANLQEARVEAGPDYHSVAQLVDEIVEVMIEDGAVKSDQKNFDTGLYGDDVYQDALEYVRGKVIPALVNLASRGAWERK